MAVREDEDYRREVGERVKAAREASEFPSAAAFYRALVADGFVPGLADQNGYYIIERGEKLPGIPALARIAEVAGVTLDWLARGEAGAPAEFWEWLESGGEAQIGDDAQARRFLASQPIPRGQVAGAAFYDLALVAYRRGLRGAEAAEALRETVRHR